jgi:xanthine dehydrogenase YagR molybdenum-binding subunit
MGWRNSSASIPPTFACSVPMSAARLAARRRSRREPRWSRSPRAVGRPVKLVASRDQGFTISTYRAETRHRIQLGASREGKLQALWHEAYELTSRAYDYFVGGTETTARIYHAPNIHTKVSIVRADRGTPGFMRSPLEVPYMFALESAVDELAVALNMDPVELRRVNDTRREPINGRAYSSRSLMACFDAAAQAFDWAKRDPTPGSMQEGDWLIGLGCATACHPALLAPAAARVHLIEPELSRGDLGNHRGRWQRRCRFAPRPALYDRPKKRGTQRGFRPPWR